MNGEQNKSDRPKLLKSLTTLRFFAAIMIVVHHSKGSFGFHSPWLLALPTGQAVSFFFVLSGFVLTYVYKSFDKPRAIRNFLIARLGRIWPLHLATLLLVFLLFPAPLRTPGGKDVPSIIFANIFLIQGWIPVWKYYFSYNWLSWAVSTEFAFYLIFPFLIRNWESTWHIKLFGTFLLALGTICCVNFFQIPMGDTAESIGEVGYIGLLYIGPLGRLFEFTLGMAVAAIYRKILSLYRLGKTSGTIMEIIALGMAVGIISFTPVIARIISVHCPWVGIGGVQWLVNGGLPCAFFGFLIFVMAMEKGLLSTSVFSGRILTKLGDMSLAIYLLHQILVRYYQWRFEENLLMSEWLAYGYYWIFVLLGSYLLVELIEQPCRKGINKLARLQKSSISQSSKPTSPPHWFTRYNLRVVVKNKNTIIALLLFIALLLPSIEYLHSAVIPKNTVDLEVARNMADHTNPRYRDIVFGKKFILKAATLSEHSDKILLKLIWQTTTEQRLRFFVAIHILDEKGRLLSNIDYRQSTGSIRVKSGTLWMETTEITKAKLRSATDIGIVIYSPDPPSTLSIDSGPRDWQGKRLLIKLQIPGKH